MSTQIVVKSCATLTPTIRGGINDQIKKANLIQKSLNHAGSGPILAIHSPRITVRGHHLYFVHALDFIKGPSTVKHSKLLSQFLTLLLTSRKALKRQRLLRKIASYLTAEPGPFNNPLVASGNRRFPLRSQRIHSLITFRFIMLLT